MTNNYIYKVFFNITSEELDNEYLNFSEQDKEKIKSLNFKSFFDYNLGSRYFLYIICDCIDMETFSELLDQYAILHGYTDISEDILSKKIDLSVDLCGKKSPDGVLLGIFLGDIDKWIVRNIDIDKILDRINEVGFNNLTKLELEYLDKYSKSKK